MSLDYAMTLTLAERDHREAMIEFVEAAQLALRAELTQEGGRIQLDSMAFWGTLIQASDLTRELERENFDIGVDTDLIMRPPNTDDWPKNVATMLHFATVVMHHTLGDCAMTQDSTLFFIRRKGIVYLNTHPDIAWPQGATLVGPHRELSLPIDEPFPLADVLQTRT